ncbi:MAG: protein kinase [Deltaproteobacteria bacterium]|nr:protein kinase [Deltaproteobacteria bacterium]
MLQLKQPARRDDERDSVKLGRFPGWELYAMNNHPGRSLEVGTVLNDKWVVLEFIGKGAMGEVYRAHQLNLKRDTAIKVVSKEWLESCEGDDEEIETTFQRFQREVEAMAPIRHPNVLQIFDYDSTSIKKGDDEIPIQYIAMEYVPGNTLRSTMSEEGFYPDEEATRSWILDYFLPVLGGVQAIHGAGIIHRDLKPENILLDGKTPKIADFGLARSDRLKSVTQSIDSKGTPPYMSPEQFMEFKRADERTDVYALGKILYETIDGKMTPKTVIPFQCATLEKADTPFFKRLDQIVCDATAEDKTKRLDSVESFWNVLVEAMEADAEEPGAKTGERFRRGLAAVLSADVEGYSRLMGEDEIATIQTLTEYREIISKAIQDHHGRLVDSSGDSVLAEFVSVVNAVACAVEIQKTLKGKNADLPENRRMRFRIGINLGDIVKEDDYVYGDGVNIAARIESLSEGGGVCISRSAFDQVKNKLSLEYEYLGEHSVKNITEPVRVYRVQMEPGAIRTKVTETKPARSPWYWTSLSAAAVVTLVIAATFVWKFYPRQSAGPPPKAPAGQTTALMSSGDASSEGLVASLPGEDQATQESENSLYESSDQSGSLVSILGDLTPDQEEEPEPDLFPSVEEDESKTATRGKLSREAIEARRSKMQDKVGGVPENVLRRQTIARVEPPSIEAAVALALNAAREAAERLIDPEFHKGEKLLVPEDFTTIQSAVDHAKPGDVVIVKEGRYFESIVMKKGVKLKSDSDYGGNRLVPVEGAQLKLPARTLRTIIDGSKKRGSSYWVIDFDQGVGRNTIVDGFTIENLPLQDQHVLANAYAINIRGASPVIMNCYIRKNASMGIGNHVFFKRTKRGGARLKRDFQWTDVKDRAEPIIYRNVVCQNLGQGIRCNSFSSPYIIGNEFFLNVFPYSAELGEKPSPGIKANRGAAPAIVGNVVHDQPGGGILCDVGKLQDLDRAKRFKLPSVVKNVVFRNGEHGPSILCSGGAKEFPVKCVGNLIYDAGWIGIDLSKDGVCIVEDNVVSGAAAPGIRVDGATVVRLNRNKVTGAKAPGFVIKNGGNVLEMVANVSDLNKGPRFVLSNGFIADPDA